MSACQERDQQTAETPFPNIVYILADDMGYGDIEALNPGSKIPTPNLNRLAAEGMVFTDAHSPSAVCTPTRYGILTGRYCFRSRLQSGVLVGHSPSLIEPGRLTVASLLKQAGYITACIGKWHLGLDFKKKDPDKPLVRGDGWMETNTSNVDYQAAIDGGPADHGFDYSFILPSSLDIQPYFYIRNRFIVNPDMISIAGSPDERSEGAFWRPGDASRDFDFFKVLPDFIEEARNFILDHRKTEPDVPFFLYLALAAPHTPWVPLEEFKDSSKAGPYGDFVVQVDHGAGKILDCLDSLGISGNTLVIFTSDNGAYWWPENIRESDHHANFIFSGMKSDLWEGGHHVPFIARWPAHIQPGSENSQLVSLTDLMATCADLVNIPLPYNAGEDSFSHLPALIGENNHEGAREHLVMQSFDGKFAVREGNWKLILSKGSGGWSDAGTADDPDIQLYDLETDVREQQNLYEGYPATVKDLTEKLDMFRRERRSRY
ncbi:MAG: arylsulfatase [Cyclobacteriaceae bacterium]|nr:arylsulfatase [Cyclobacteriaceae bacterium]